MPNYKLSLCYDGSRYKGWQRQGNTDNTIQAKMENLLSRLLSQPVEIHASGRTDAGVHARNQVCSFRAETDTSVEVMLTELRKYAPDDIGVLSLEEAAPRFHARLNCVRKSYLYRIWNSEEPQVFERRYMYCYPKALDINAMEKAAQLLFVVVPFNAELVALSQESIALFLNVTYDALPVASTTNTALASISPSYQVV